jgi:homoserine O-acetyltransferase
MTTWPTAEGRFELGDLALQSGATLPAAMLRWKSHGTLNATRDNVIVYPTSYGGQYPDLEWLIAPDRILDPTKFFIIQIDMFANGGSSSPSNNPGWPGLVTIWDNVQAQYRLVHELFGVERVAGVYGFSMGALQAYHWAALFPDKVDAAIAICGVSRTAVHNQVFLKGLLAILQAAPEYIGNGQFSAEPAAALRAYGRIYAGWALSQDFYRAGLHLSALGAPDLEAFLKTWEASFSRRTAADYYAQASTWIAADISANPLYGGDLPKALAAIKARMLLLPGETDLYFRVADNAAELPHLARAELRPIPSVWGHRAGNPQQNPMDEAFLREAVHAWLA